MFLPALGGQADVDLGQLCNGDRYYLRRDLSSIVLT